MNTYYVAGIPYSDELYHHGIKGQKWGKRNGPPYPLDPEDHSKAEEKAGWEKSLSSQGDLVRKGNSNGTNSKPKWLRKSYEQLQSDFKKQIDLIRPKLSGIDANRVKQIGKGILIAGLIGSTSYVIYKNLDKSGFENVERVHDSILEKDNAAKLIGDMMDANVSDLSDRDEVISAGTMLQRIVSVPRHKGMSDVMKAESIRDIIYATHDKNDNRIYRLLFSMGSGKKVAVERKVINDLKIPSTHKATSTFVEMLGNKDFKEALAKDIFVSPETIDRMSVGHLFERLYNVAGSSRSRANEMYFKALQEKGYNAVIDYNDQGTWAKSPIILLSAQSDTVITGKHAVTRLDSIIDSLRVKAVN